MHGPININILILRIQFGLADPTTLFEMCWSQFPVKISFVMTTNRTQRQKLKFSEIPGTNKSLARPGRKQPRKHVRDACDFNNIETPAVIKFPLPPLKARRRRKFTPFWQKHQIVSSLVGLRTYQHPGISTIACYHTWPFLYDIFAIVFIW